MTMSAKIYRGLGRVSISHMNFFEHFNFLFLRLLHESLKEIAIMLFELLNVSQHFPKGTYDIPINMYKSLTHISQTKT